MKHIEPFAWGYIHSGRNDMEYRIANGMKTAADEIEVNINTSNWFQSPLGAMTNFAVRYNRAEGIDLNEGIKNRNAEKALTQKYFG